MTTYGLTCKGCGEPIKAGGCVYVTVTRAQHVASFPSHENHREATRVAGKIRRGSVTSRMVPVSRRKSARSGWEGLAGDDRC